MTRILYHARLGRLLVLSGPDSHYKVKVVCVTSANKKIPGTEITLPLRALSCIKKNKVVKKARKLCKE